VLGVECSAQAAAEYFDQHGLTPTVRRDGPFDMYAGGGVEIAVGDVFDLGALDLSGIAGYYDRAALIALSPEQRARYAALLCDTLPRTTRGLVVALDYPQDEKAGPPFSVPPEEVAALYGARFGLSTLHTADVLSANPGFVAAGVTRLWDHVVHLAPPA
jgi:thiopurine S-methyltransferase